MSLHLLIVPARASPSCAVLSYRGNDCLYRACPLSELPHHLICLSQFGFARFASYDMGTTCCKATVKQLDMSGHYYHTSRSHSTHYPAINSHNATACIQSGSSLLADSTTSSGTVIHPMHETSSIVSRRMERRELSAKTSFDADSVANDLITATHGMMDAEVLNRQMQVLIRLKNKSLSSRQSVAEMNGAIAVASSAESSSASSELVVASRA